MAKRNRARKPVHLPVVIEQDEDGVFIVAVPTLRGFRSYGYTIDEAMRNIAEAAALCLEDEDGVPQGTRDSQSRFVGIRDLEIIA